MTNEIAGWIGTLTSAVEQMQRWPASVLIVAVLIVSGSVLKSLSFFPNRFIPIAVLGIGSMLNSFLGETGAVNPSQRHPEIVLALHGLLLGFAAWALHAFLLRRLERYIPFLAGKSGDTVMIEKPKDTEPK
jgi:hypothetical protein